MFNFWKNKKIHPVTPALIVLFLLLIPNIANGQVLESLLKFTADGMADMFGWLAMVLFQLVSLITILSGTILNFVVKYTVVDMATNITGSSGVVNLVWGKVRDLANMGFIFILLYASIQLILGTGAKAQRTVVNVITVAVLINFSLFVTKIIIDTSNILAVTFYGAISPGTLDDALNGGLANSLMEPLRVTTILSTVEGADLSGTISIIVGVMGSVVSLIAAFVFFSIAIMFAIRFVTLIFVMILSPIAFLAMVLPQMRSTVDKWWEALIGQAFFAPIYLFITWIVIMLANGLFPANGTIGEAFTGIAKPDGEGGITYAIGATGIQTLMSFMIITVMLIASLIIAKSWSDKAGSGVKSATKFVTGAAGNTFLGGASKLGRNTFGAGGSALSDSEKLKEVASRKGFKGATARLALTASRKTAGASFDVRGTKSFGDLSKTTGVSYGKPEGKGGFAEKTKQKAKEKKEFAESLGPSAIKIDALEQKLEALPEGSEEWQKVRDEIDRLKGVNKEEVEKREKAKIKADPVVKSKKELDEIEKQIKEKEEEIKNTEIPEMAAQRQKEVDALKEGFEATKKASEARRKEIESQFRDDKDEYETVSGQADVRKSNYIDHLRDPKWFEKIGYKNYSIENKRILIPKSSKQAIVDIKKKNKKVEDIVKEALKASGQIKEEKKSEPEETNDEE